MLDASAPTAELTDAVMVDTAPAETDEVAAE